MDKKDELKSINELLKDGSMRRSKWFKKLMERKEVLEFQIWKEENTESFENHREHLKRFVDSGCFNSVFS